MKGEPDADRSEFVRNAIIFAWTAPAAVAVFVVFRAIYTNINETAKAVGQIDAGTTMGLAMGRIAMFGGSGVFGAIALVAAIRALRAWSRTRAR
jgi:hypothetical protein